MNPLVRYFLPSQVRGVYRFDDTFATVDNDTYAQFVESKFRFLPCSLIEPIRRAANFWDDFTYTRQQLCLSESHRDTNAVRRARLFFSQHKYFDNANECEGDINYLEVQFVKKILAPLLNEAGLASVQPQKKIGPYKADFAIEGPSTKLVIEVDGFGKFSDRGALNDFIERQTYIACQGWKVLRFTYGQIMNTPSMTLKVLYDFFNADSHFRQFLVSSQQEGLFNGARGKINKGITVFNIVNGFYRIQDWFVEFVVTREDTENKLVLYDDFNFSFPLVALSVSSLYRFLDAIAEVVDIAFNLPNVSVCGSVDAIKWRPHLHPSIHIVSNQHSQTISVNAQTIQNYSASVPAPTEYVNDFETLSVRI